MSLRQVPNNDFDEEAIFKENNKIIAESDRKRKELTELEQKKGKTNDNNEKSSIDEQIALLKAELGIKGGKRIRRPTKRRNSKKRKMTKRRKTKRRRERK